MRLRLSDAEREKYGCDEWLEFDPSAVTLGEMEDLQQAVDLDPDELYARLDRGIPVLVDGKPAFDSEGKPETKADIRAWAALFWLALRANGIAVEWPEFRRHYRYRQALWTVQATEPEPGKDEPSASPSSDAPTPQT